MLTTVDAGLLMLARGISADNGPLLTTVPSSLPHSAVLTTFTVLTGEWADAMAAGNRALGATSSLYYVFVLLVRLRTFWSLATLPLLSLPPTHLSTRPPPSASLTLPHPPSPSLLLPPPLCRSAAT